MILNEEFFDDEDYTPEIEQDDYGKYGGIDGHQYKLSIKIVGNDSSSDSDSDEYGLEAREWKKCLEWVYELFEFSDFEKEFDHSEFIYYNNRKEFVMGFSRSGTEGADFNTTCSFFYDLMDSCHTAYDGKYKEIIISITKLQYEKYPVIVCYIKDKNDIAINATRIAYKL